MPRIPGTTNAQTLFLRGFRRHPAAPTPVEWPSPTILRRWLRRPAFVDALAQLREVLRFRADLHLTVAASEAAQQLQSLPTDDCKRLLDVLRLDHMRHRAAAETSMFAGASSDDDDFVDDPGDVAAAAINPPPNPMTS